MGIVVVLCLTGDVMTGRGVDQILPAAGDPRSDATSVPGKANVMTAADQYARPQKLGRFNTWGTTPGAGFEPVTPWIHP